MEEMKGGDFSVLFIGNSYGYTNDLPEVLTKMGAADEPVIKFRTDHRTPGSCSFERHWKEKVAVKKIQKGGWDVVVLQNNSLGPIKDIKGMYKYARKLDAEIKKVGAKTVFYMTWAREYDPSMIEILAKGYNGVAAELGAPVAPVGRAWEKSLKERSGLGLHSYDQAHPNERGTYLAACVFYAVLTGRSPVGLSRGELTEVSEEEAGFLQKIALETVKEN